MKLTYRGHTYESTFAAPEPAESSQEVLFLGNRCKRKQVIVATRRSTPANMTYRGVHYTR